MGGLEDIKRANDEELAKRRAEAAKRKADRNRTAKSRK